MRLLLINTLLFLTVVAGPGGSKSNRRFAAIGGSETKQIGPADIPYMPTGFYFLADDSTKGVKMRAHGSNKIYTISSLAFASVKNIKEAKLSKTPYKNKIFTELCLTFDAKGTDDLKNGTGIFFRPKIAVVVANQLLYVIDNTTKISTGVMCISLPGYSESEMEALKNEVQRKR